jgi:3-oxoacyl-[acyl-carrier protein] reductase
MSARFAGRVALVTGAARGLGEGIARRLAAEGAHVVVVDRAGADAVARDIGGTALTVDLAEAPAIEAMIDRVAADHGGIDLLVPNAGVPQRAMPVADLDVETIDRLLTVNVRGVVLTCKYAIPHLRPGASVVITASIGARRPREGMTVYNATKGALVTFTRGLAAELAPDVRVNAVNPVLTETAFVTEMNGGAPLDAAARAAMVAGIPMGRPATPADVASAVAYLASDDAGFLTGVCLDVDGGRSIR